MVAAVTKKTFHWNVVQTQNCNMLYRTLINQFAMTEQDFDIIENMLELMKNVMSSNNFSVARWHHV